MATRKNSRPASSLPRGVFAGAARPLAPLLLAGLALLLGACLPPQASYKFGLGTSRISGTVLAAPEGPVPGSPLVVAYLYHHQFIERPDGSAILVPSARVIQPAPDGRFSVPVETDVVRADLFFIAPGHLTRVFHFQRQVGVGDITYRAALESMSDWRSHYYTFLSPQLEQLILEPRYRLPAAEQQTLGRWMQEQDARLKPTAVPAQRK